MEIGSEARINSQMSKFDPMLCVNVLIGVGFAASGSVDIEYPTTRSRLLVNGPPLVIASLCLINSAITYCRQKIIKMVYFSIWVCTFSWIATNGEGTSADIKKYQQMVSLSSIFLMWIDSVRHYKSKNYMVNAPNFIFLFFAFSSSACQLSYQFFQKIAALHLAQAILKIGSGVFFIITAIMSQVSNRLETDNTERQRGSIETLHEPLLVEQCGFSSTASTLGSSPNGSRLDSGSSDEGNNGSLPNGSRLDSGSSDEGNNGSPQDGDGDDLEQQLVLPEERHEAQPSEMTSDLSNEEGSSDLLQDESRDDLDLSGKGNSASPTAEYKAVFTQIQVRNGLLERESDHESDHESENESENESERDGKRRMSV